MSKLNFEDIQEKHKTALAEKESNTKDVITAIADNELQEKYTSIQKEKKKIESLEDLEKYKKRVKSFFDEVYRIITAPGVNKFIEWLESLDKKGNVKISSNMPQTLIDDYSDYDEQIKSILENKFVIEAGNSIFENIKSSVRTNIIKRLQSLGSKKDEIKENLPDFIEELNDLLEGLSEIEELNFVDEKDFYTNNIEEKGNDDYAPDIDKDADFYFDLIKQVVEKKDFLTTNQDIISLSTIAENIQNSIDDINNTIKTIKTINVSSDNEKDILTFYNKFEKSLNLKTGQNDISGFIQESINDTWNKIINAYNTCQVFYSNNSQEKVTKLNSNKDKWSNFAFASKIEQYILTINNIISDNPIKSIDINEISKIKTTYIKVERSINSLEENNPKDDIINYFSNITSDFENKKIEILKKLKTADSEIKKIESAVEEINNFIDSIKESENLLDALNDDFIDGILGSYDYIKKQFTTAIEKSDIKDDLEYLDKISSDEYVLSKTDLVDNIERFKRLLEYDLININLTKNI